jgi:hypothetical protein
MAPEEHRPITDRNSPLALGAFVIGLVFAVGTAVFVKSRTPAPPVAPVVAAAPIVDPASVTPTASLPEPTPQQQSPPIAVPPTSTFVMPRLPGQSHGHTGSESLNVDIGTSPNPIADVISYYEAAFGRCARTWHRNNVDVVSCMTNGMSLEAVLTPRGGKTEIYAETVTMRPMPAVHVAVGSDRGFCAAALRWLELPGDATPRGSSGGGLEGTCELTMPRAPTDALDDLASRVAGSIHSFDIGGDRATHLEAIAMNVGVFWQIDIVPGSDGGSHVLLQHIDTESVAVPRPLAGHAEKVLALMRTCHAPCSSELLAHEPDEKDISTMIKWDKAVDRCMFDCGGQPSAPARVAPFDAFMPNPSK